MAVYVREAIDDLLQKYKTILKRRQRKKLRIRRRD